MPPWNAPSSASFYESALLWRNSDTLSFAVYSQDQLLRLSNGALESPNWLSDSEQMRLSQFKHARRRTEYLSARYLLRALSHRHFRTHNAGTVGSCAIESQGLLRDWPLREREQLPPAYLDARYQAWQISLSHGGGFIAAAIADTAVGIDVESAARVLSSTSFDPLLGQTFATDTLRTEHWVATEAWLKMHHQAALPEQIRAARLHRFEPNLSAVPLPRDLSAVPLPRDLSAVPLPRDLSAQCAVRVCSVSGAVFAVASHPKSMQNVMFTHWETYQRAD